MAGITQTLEPDFIEKDSLITCLITPIVFFILNKLAFYIS